MTIVDIAKEAGYSVSTVSRVLNGRRDVSEEARDRIMRIVEAYQFVPNNNAKHLKQTVSQSILPLSQYLQLSFLHLVYTDEMSIF